MVDARADGDGEQGGPGPGEKPVGQDGLRERDQGQGRHKFQASSRLVYKYLENVEVSALRVYGTLITVLCVY